MTSHSYGVVLVFCDRYSDVVVVVYVVVVLFIDHLLSYDMPQGQQRTRARGHNLELYDVIYDGEISNDWLSGGLGLLTGKNKNKHIHLSHVFLGSLNSIKTPTKWIIICRWSDRCPRLPVDE